MRAWAFIACIAVVLSVWLSISGARQRPDDEMARFTWHQHIREIAIRSQSRQVLGRKYLVIGDSITESAVLPVICERVPINAGIGSSGIASFSAGLAARLIGEVNPDVVVVAVGTNDVLSGIHVQSSVIEYGKIVSAAKGRAIVLVPVPPMRDDLLNERADTLNSALLRAYGKNMAARIAGIETVDGVHLTAEDYAQWRAAIVDAVKQRLNCR